MTVAISDALFPFLQQIATAVESNQALRRWYLNHRWQAEFEFSGQVMHKFEKMFLIYW